MRALVTPESQGIAAKPTYGIFAVVDEASIDSLYENMKSFWFRRHNLQVPDEDVERVLEDYRQSLSSPIRTKQAQLLRGFCDEKLSENGELSFIEVGGANGTTLHYLNSFLDLERVRYLGIEPYDQFRKDQEQYFPNHTVVVSNVEKFCDVDLESMIETPVTAVLCYGILCMTPCRVTAAFLKQVAQFTDNIIGLDYCFDYDGDRFSDARERIFKYHGENGQFYFVHKFGEYLDNIGFKAVKRIPVPYSDGMYGWETFHFQRRR